MIRPLVIYRPSLALPRRSRRTRHHRRVSSFAMGCKSDHSDRHRKQAREAPAIAAADEAVAIRGERLKTRKDSSIHPSGRHPLSRAQSIRVCRVCSAPLRILSGRQRVARRNRAPDPKKHRFSQHGLRQTADDAVSKMAWSILVSLSSVSPRPRRPADLGIRRDSLVSASRVDLVWDIGANDEPHSFVDFYGVVHDE